MQGDEDLDKEIRTHQTIYETMGISKAKYYQKKVPNGAGGMTSYRALFDLYVIPLRLPGRKWYRDKKTGRKYQGDNIVATTTRRRIELFKQRMREKWGYF